MIPLIYSYLAQAQLKVGGDPIDNLNSATGSSDFITGKLLPFIFGLLGALSVLYIIIGGMRFVLSGGSPDAVNRARNTILYALIGLVVSLLSFTIVNFVLSAVNPPETGTNPLFGPSGLLTQLAQWMVYAISIISVVMIIYGAFRYVISGGDSSATKSARDTILYAVVGLIVAISSQAIVTFVLKAI